ncbi:ISKra4 family transposase [Nitrosomonas sp.]|uniref:ISKra4 family transposase n=1 Tax=Nitrosomonas sp. TaxID=42353 RepID=UPI0025D6624E|nr:ISKra4 family transposase [Nitrosomonas sp.]
MHFKIQVVIEEESGQSTLEDIVELNKGLDHKNTVGLSLLESKQLLQSLQRTIVLHQAASYSKAHQDCPCCQKKRKIKGHHTIQFRSLFGIVAIPSLRLYHCSCANSSTKSFSPLNEWLPEHTSPELMYIETKWASLMSYGSTADLLHDVLPVNQSLNPATVRNHLHNIAKRQEAELEGKPDHLSGCPRDWGELPKPGKPIVVGIDGGYVRNWEQKNTNFEIIAGKSFSKTQPSKRFGLVQKMDDNPQRRLMNVLKEQGMQANQQITFLSDGADNVRNLQYRMYPESEHVLDWFHLTMKLTVLNQFAKGMAHTDPDEGAQVTKALESTKWYLWHGNVERALDQIEDCVVISDDEAIRYTNRKKFLKHLDEMDIYIRNNQHLIPNYGEKWRYGETISTAFVESTINEVVTKRMVKKQQMQWTHEGAHYMLQTRTAVLNNDLHLHFERWYPELKIVSNVDRPAPRMKKVA